MGYRSMLAQTVIKWIILKGKAAWCVFVGKIGQQFVKNLPYHAPKAPQVECDDLEVPRGRARSCYGLNLGTSTDITDDTFIDTDTESSHESSHRSSHFAFITPLEVAVQTSKIFNGVVVGNDGVIKSQNKRSRNKLRGKVVPEGQSRQAVKIEKMLKSADSEPMRKIKRDGTISKPPSQLVLVCGQYEDLHHLLSACSEEILHEKTICWLPCTLLVQMSDYCSTKDVMNLAQSCKTMRRNLLEVTIAARQRHGKRKARQRFGKRPPQV